MKTLVLQKESQDKHGTENPHEQGNDGMHHAFGRNLRIKMYNVCKEMIPNPQADSVQNTSGSAHELTVAWKPE
jgi:hypothetical protein